ncbi:MAG: hypothetical protein QW594_03255 [Candidatus Woesearchaeota archaeon]
MKRYAAASCLLRKHPLLSFGNASIVLQLCWSPDGAGPPTALQAFTSVALLMLLRLVLVFVFLAVEV